MAATSPSVTIPEMRSGEAGGGTYGTRIGSPLLTSTNENAPV